MAAIYSVSAGGFVQDPRRYVFQVAGELEIPSGLTLPYQFCKKSATLSSARMTFTTAGTSTYNVLVESTNANGGGLQTIINTVVTPLSGQAVSLSITNPALAANHILRVTITQNTGTPSTDVTLVLE